MIKEEFRLTDLKGRTITQQRKTGRSIEIDGNSKFCGHRFLLKQKLYGDKKCIYCAKWFHWCQDDASKWIKNKNIDDLNVDSVLEPLHCGSSHCEEYHHRYLRHQEKSAKENEALQAHKMNEMFKLGKSMRYIS